MTPEIIEYSGYLVYPTLPAGRLDQARLVAAQLRQIIDIEPRSLEIEYVGRDSGRAIMQALHQLASIIGEADGEVVCEIDVEETTPMFEFYSIRGGKLLRQRGQVVRQAVEEVEPASPDRVHQVA